jgi:[ribosomal protein S18]-alanine N-acetyltransferase
MMVVEELRVPVAEADRAAVLALEVASQQRPLGWDALVRDVATDADAGADAVTLVARDGERRVVGHASARRMVEEVHVLRLVVAEAHRRAGVGRALLDGLVDWAGRIDAARITLEVRASNVAALELYRRAGFVTLGERPGYYPDGEDARVCTRELVPAGGR